MKATINLLLWIVIPVAAVIGILLFGYVDIVQVGHDGMAPSVIGGEEVLMWRGVSDPDMGDILICENPLRPGILEMGRVMGKPGMEIRAERGNLIVSGTQADRNSSTRVRFFDMEWNREAGYTISEEVIGNTKHFIFMREGYELSLRTIRVRPGKVYLLSDNRSSDSHDSRRLGEFDLSTCKGSIFYRVRSTERSAVVGNRAMQFVH